MDNKANIKVQITEFITNTFPLARRRESIDDDSLLESGVVDSFGILEIVGFLEKNFHITIEDEELVPDNFEFVDAMTNFVLRKRHLNLVDEFSK